MVGPSEVGKSSLINSILNINKNWLCCPMTKNIERLESNSIPFLRLIDSRGIDKNLIAGFSNTFEELKKYIQSQINYDDFGKFIHVIWYCCTGTRLEDNEVKFLQDLSKQYLLL